MDGGGGSWIQGSSVDITPPGIIPSMESGWEVGVCIEIIRTEKQAAMPNVGATPSLRALAQYFCMWEVSEGGGPTSLTLWLSTKTSKGCQTCGRWNPNKKFSGKGKEKNNKESIFRRDKTTSLFFFLPFLTWTWSKSVSPAMGWAGEVVTVDPPPYCRHRHPNLGFPCNAIYYGSRPGVKAFPAATLSADMLNIGPVGVSNDGFALGPWRESFRWRRGRGCNMYDLFF